MIPITFIECDTCRAKSGSPLLCAVCRTNRQTITDAAAAIVRLEAQQASATRLAQAATDNNLRVGHLVHCFQQYVEATEQARTALSVALQRVKEGL